MDGRDRTRSAGRLHGRGSGFRLAAIPERARNSDGPASSKPLRIQRLAVALGIVRKHAVDKALDLLGVVERRLGPALILGEFVEQKLRETVLLVLGNGPEPLDDLLHEASHGVMVGKGGGS